MVISEPVRWCLIVPITAATADEMAKDRATQVTAGLDYLVSKPINTRQFAEAILRRLPKTKFPREQLVAALPDNILTTSVRPRRAPRRSANLPPF